VSLDVDQLRACEAAMQTPGWALLEREFEAKREATVREVMSTMTDSASRVMLVWHQAGRDEVLAWFAKQLETARQLRKVE
jgi:hypothetical protein